MAMDFKKILDSQRDFFATGKTRDIEFRINSLKKLKQVIINKNDEIARALKKDFSKNAFETFTSEIMSPLDEINIAIKHLHS